MFLSLLNALPNNVENKVEAIMEPCAAGTHLATDLTCKSGKFPDSLESFQRVWKVSRQSEQFLNSLKNLASLKICHRKKQLHILFYVI